jgi:hypothetical protein
MKIPPNYIELNVGDIIKQDDLVFSNLKGWHKRQSDSDYIGTYYNPKVGQNRTFRKKNIMTIKFNFFVPKISNTWGGRLSLCASDNKGGHYFFTDGTYHCFDENSSSESLRRIAKGGSDYNEINLWEIKKRFNPLQFKLICNKLGISLEKLEITDDKRKNLIEKLKESRAFNQDSALKIENEEDLYYQLAEEGIIKQENDRFYVE